MNTKRFEKQRFRGSKLNQRFNKNNRIVRKTDKTNFRAGLEHISSPLGRFLLKTALNAENPPPEHVFDRILAICYPQFFSPREGQAK